MSLTLLKQVRNRGNLVFTFRSEAEKFAAKNRLEIIYQDGNMIDDEHYFVKGYKSKLYWLCNE